MALVTGDGNREGEVMGYNRFDRGREGGGEVTPQCQRRMTQRRATRRLGRLKVAIGVWRLKMTKGN
jgi:hypothetical protein